MFTQTSFHVAGLRQHPFINGIMETPLLSSWKTPTLHKNDMMKDPYEHIDIYVSQ